MLVGPLFEVIITDVLKRFAHICEDESDWFGHAPCMEIVQLVLVLDHVVVKKQICCYFYFVLKGFLYLNYLNYLKLFLNK